MKRRIVTSVLFCGVLTMVLGADSISIQNCPSPQKGKIAADGPFSVDPANNQGTPPVTFYATLNSTPPQQSFKYATTQFVNGQWTWDCTLLLVQGQYEARVKLLTVEKVTGKKNETWDPPLNQPGKAVTVN